MKTYSLLANKIVFSSTLWRTEDDLHKIYVRKEADTIEELCDEFVYIGEKGNVVLGMSYMQIEDVKKYNVNKNQIYGAIWTEKGLIYVAKMNENGEFKLL